MKMIKKYHITSASLWSQGRQRALATDIGVKKYIEDVIKMIVN